MHRDDRRMCGNASNKLIKSVWRDAGDSILAGNKDSQGKVAKNKYYFKTGLNA